MGCAERAVPAQPAVPLGGPRRPVGAGQGWGSPPAERWARLVVDVKCPLRRGAWYPVLSAGPEETVVVVRDRAVILPHHCLEITNTRPSQWAVRSEERRVGKE